MYGELLRKHLPPPTADEISLLRGDLIGATLNMGKIVPAVTALHPSRFGEIEMGCAPTMLKDKINEFDASLLPARVYEVATGPPLPLSINPALTKPIDIDCTVQRQSLMDSVHMNILECQLIEQATRGQSQNKEWYQQRMGAITSSVANDIVKLYSKIPGPSYNKMANKCLGKEFLHMKDPSVSNIKPLRYGHEQESVARAKYLESFQGDHVNADVKESGLLVCGEKPYLRASPDGIVSCSCHGTRLLEIKCPYSARDLDIATAVSQKKIDYLDQADDGSFMLSKQKRGYYTQVQMAMAVADLRECDFVVWTPRDILIINITFDELFWTKTLETLECFFRDYLLKGIIGGPLPTDNLAVATHAPAQCDSPPGLPQAYQPNIGHNIGI
jgi:hypothetical protein